MPQSLSNVLLHCVFSTKNRNPWITDDFRSSLHAYISGIVQNCNCTVLRINSVEDHIHILLDQSRTCTIANLIKEIKTGSTFWIKNNQLQLANFHWQTGYGAFSISPAHKSQLISYIDGQKEHHKTVTFKDEYRRLLDLYQIRYDEKYVWD